MSKLRNKLPHMIGQSVNVDGQRFQIDENGFTVIADQNVVNKLLQNKTAWALVPPEVRVAPKEIKKPEEPKVVTPSKIEEPKVVTRKPVVKKEKVEKKEKTVKDDSEYEWPDPTPSMSIAYLREMANAYPSVNYTIKTSKVELIKRINEAMYDYEEE